MDCLFCKIANSEINSKIIYEDDLVIAFLNIYPDSVGHTLIIPKKHFNDLEDVTKTTLAHIMKVSKIIKVKLEKYLKTDGLTLIQNNGIPQEIKHFHLHLKPFYLKKKCLSIEEVYELLK